LATDEQKIAIEHDRGLNYIQISACVTATPQPVRHRQAQATLGPMAKVQQTAVVTPINFDRRSHAFF
jgi:hypothetical protein